MANVQKGNGRSSMTKHKKSACTSSVHKKGHFVEVKARCHVGKAKLTTASACKKPSKKSAKHTKRREVPVPCKGLKKKSRRECAKRVCAQRPKEYQADCFRKAGIR